MSLWDEIRSMSNGAQFKRADLHIHSFGDTGSYDVTDAGMTPEAIVDTALAENLQVIAITDHNTIGNVRLALKHAEGNQNVFVVPGVELSTPQGHLLVYFETPEKLEAFYGKLDITSDKKACNNTMPQCLKLADDFGGFGIAAHIDLDAGLEKVMAKFDGFKQDILNCKNLLGLEVSHAGNGHWFSHTDDHIDRRNCAKIRCETLSQEEEIELAKVMASDAHSIGALGRNAQGNKKLSRFKMESRTFDALKIALRDCAARVRLEDLIPERIPRFVGMKLEGGFLRDQVIHFSKNLTCIIGGRGAGKSTMLESIRVAAGSSVENTIVDCEVWPDAISLIFEDESGQRHTVRRVKLSRVINVTNPSDGPIAFGIESYGQGETAETIQHCDKDPSILLRFVDGFVDLQELKRKDQELRDALLNNQTEIERLQLDVNRISETEKAKALAESQVATLKKQKAGEVVELEQKLANERKFRDQLRATLNTFLGALSESLMTDELKNAILNLDGSTLAVGKTEFETVKRLVVDLAAEVDALSEQLKTKIGESVTNILAELKTWVTKESETQGKIEELRRELEKQKIKLDIGFIRKVTKDATDYAAKLVELKKSVGKQQEAFKARRTFLKERRELKSRMFTTRQAFATQLNKNLATTVVDYHVNLKFVEGVLSSEFDAVIKNEMNWRTAQVPKATLIASSISPVVMLDLIERRDTGRIEALTDYDGNRVFNKQEAADVLSTLGQWKAKVQIERCAFEDRPEIKVSRVVEGTGGKKIPIIKDFGQLSLGQQQSILLSILLFSKSKTPLIIDQPEDNLDSEFIYKTLVRTLRRIKEHRQVIIVTHNANIAVLGDAELIIPLRGQSDLAVVRDRGSIDTPETKEIVCTILEGSKKAFKRRQEVYGA